MPALRYGLPSATISDVARASGCSVRTVRRYLGGHSVSGTALVSIEAALRARKLLEHVRESAKPANVA